MASIDATSAARASVVTVTTGGTVTTEGALTDDEKAMLELERSWWKHAGAKDGLIRERFGVSPTVYFARLNALIDRPEALAADAMIVHRLLRLRDQRRAHRSARRATFQYLRR